MQTHILIPILLVIHALVCMLMVFVILMQRTKQEGLGAAFGGGFTDSVFGAQTSTILSKATVWLAGMFFVLSIALGYLYSHHKPKSVIEQDLITAPVTTPAAAPVAPTAPTTATPAVPPPTEKK